MVAQPQIVPLTCPPWTVPPPVAECSPVRVGPSRVFVSTAYTYEGRWSANGISCAQLVSKPDPGCYWRRSYAGVFAAEQIGTHTVWFLHGENKNELVAGVRHLNTISGDRSCFSGYRPDGTYVDCWADYFGFCSATRDGQDLGPVVWPRAGYLRGGRQASCGIRHPSSIVHDGHVYVFYIDCSTPPAIAVARSPVTAAAAPGSFQTWTAHGWRPSLPAGFAHTDRRFLSRPGPAAAAILGESAGGYLAACAVPGGFLALEYTLAGGAVGHQRWRSNDLVHWHRDGELLWPSSSWSDSTVRFARPLDEQHALATTGSQPELVAFA